ASLLGNAALHWPRHPRRLSPSQMMGRSARRCSEARHLGLACCPFSDATHRLLHGRCYCPNSTCLPIGSVCRRAAPRFLRLVPSRKRTCTRRSGSSDCCLAWLETSNCSFRKSSYREGEIRQLET